MKKAELDRLKAELQGNENYIAWDSSSLKT